MEGTTRKRTRRSKRIEGTVGKGFLICLGILILLNILVPDKTMSEKENRILSSKPKLTWSGLVSGDFMMKYEDYLADQFAVVLRLDVDPIRHVVSPPYIYMYYGGVPRIELELVLLSHK